MTENLYDINSEAAAEDEGNASIKSSLAYIQLEKHNERLKEALLRYVPYCHCYLILTLLSLRDMSQQTEQEQRRRITEMEKDITSIDDLQGLLYLSRTSTPI